jgi:hypothetical protein
MKQFIPCRKCSGKGINGKSDGFIYDKSRNVLIECECHISWRNKKNLLSRMEKSGLQFDDFSLNYDISKDYKGTSSLQSVEKVEKYISEFKKGSDKFHHLILYIDGGNGTQKTTIGNFIGREIVSTVKPEYKDDYIDPLFYKAYFIQMNDLIKWLQAKDSFNSDEQSILTKRIEEADVLIIDESFDKSKVTIYKSGYQIPFLDSFLRKWMTDSTKSLIFISNVPPSEIEANGYSHSIQDFVERSVKIYNSEFTFNDNYISQVDRIDGGLF